MELNFQQAVERLSTECTNKKKLIASLHFNAAGAGRSNVYPKGKLYVHRTKFAYLSIENQGYLDEVKNSCSFHSVFYTKKLLL